MLSLSGAPRLRPFVATAAAEGGAAFSPDGHWVAYASDDRNVLKIFVQAFSGQSQKMASLD